MKNKIEILAPGGDADSVKAALLAGADAVYCGLSAFNARQRAENISMENLEELIAIAHDKNCRIFLTLNTLILDSEFPSLAVILNAVRNAGIDAVIVQDAGLLYILKEYFPDIEVHASTQMTTHNAGQLEFLSKFSIAQVNLSRELSLEEIRDMCAHGHQHHMHIEVFVHGAFCISFSGQCYMSSSLCGLSGNRGACVQPCRRRYRSSEKNTAGVPFNLKDNSVFSSAAELADAGVDSFKIEGRMKNFRYVHKTVSAWRRQADALVKTGKARKADDALHTVFNRHFSDGYLKGNISRDMFADTSRDQSLIPVSTVQQYSADEKILTLEQDAVIESGTAVYIYTDEFEFVCTGIITESMSKRKFRFTIEHVLKGKILGGQILYMQKDSADEREIKKQIDALHPEKKPLTVSIKGSEGTRLTACFTYKNKEIILESDSLLSKARSDAPIENIISEKMGQLGATQFKLAGIDITGFEKKLFLPVKEINELRRKGAEALADVKPVISDVMIKPPAQSIDSGKKIPRIACLVSGEDDFNLAEDGITILFEIPPGLNALAETYTDIFTRLPGIIPWFPSILIGDDFTAAVKLLQIIKAPYIISDNTGIGMEADKHSLPWIAGPMLNIANSYALTGYNTYAGCSGAFLSAELGKHQLRDINAPQSFTLWHAVFSPVLVMNTRQCIIRNVSACGKNAVDCNCIKDCSRKASVYDEKNNMYTIEKRRGFYNQVYAGRHYFNPDILRDASMPITDFVLDMRDIATQTLLAVSKKDFVKAVKAYACDGSGTKQSISSMVQNTSTGQYFKGL